MDSIIFKERLHDLGIAGSLIQEGEQVSIHLLLKQYTVKKIRNMFFPKLNFVERLIVLTRKLLELWYNIVIINSILICIYMY